MTYSLQVTLKSDTTFGSGDSVPGLVDHEVNYDPETGLPEISGSTLRGLLVEECANIFYGLELAGVNTKFLEPAARFLFGEPGSLVEDTALFHVGTARLPADLSNAVAYTIDQDELSQADVLASLTAIRTQTRCDKYGAPEHGSLRSYRVVLRKLDFEAPLTFDIEPAEEELILLSACARGVRRGGMRRNRGTGHIAFTLLEDGEPLDVIGHFKSWILSQRNNHERS